MNSLRSNKHQRVVVTAVGVISPLGNDTETTIQSLRSGRDGVHLVEQFNLSGTRAKTAGQVKLPPNLEPSPLRKLHPASQMLLAAGKQLAQADPHFVPEQMVIGTTSGGMSFGEAFFRAEWAKDRTPNKANWLANYLPQKALSDLSNAQGWSAPGLVIANACASGTNAVGHAFRLIRAGRYTRILCGGYDAISELVFVGFDSLQASTSEQIRPFDKHRSGLVLGEGAAVLALESLASAKMRSAPILAEITGYGISTDNHHLTQPHPSGIGPRLAMRRALADARLNPEKIDYINAHGTGTPLNDATEGLAIAEIFQDSVPVSSTKSMMGHALGAAGAIEAVLSILAIRGQFIPPNIHYSTPDPAWTLDIVANTAREAKIQRVLSNSFGFGGTNATIILESVCTS